MVERQKLSAVDGIEIVARHMSDLDEFLYEEEHDYRIF